MTKENAPLVDLVAGARPNLMKLAPVLAALERRGRVRCRLVHTGQHYDASMNDVFFEELGIRAPDVTLGVGSGTHGAQTARIIERYEALLLERRPEVTLVPGDVNSTIGCALAAVKLGVRVAHLEAGLRSFDRRMPEEINRVLTDAISVLHLVSEESGLRHLASEGIAGDGVVHVGNAMIDTLLGQLERARPLERYRALGLEERGYGLVTMHRPSNVDDPEVLRRLWALLCEIASRALPLVLPVHPRTRGALERADLGDDAPSGLHLLPPLPYLENLSLMAGARLVLTDSGGIQEETTALAIPCLTLRENTERPVTIERGTNRLVGNDPARIRAALDEVLARPMPGPCQVPLWDGRAGERAAAAVEALLGLGLADASG